MSRKNIWFVRGFLATQINHWALFPVLLFAFFGIGQITAVDVPDPLLWMAVGIVPALFFFFRAKLRKFWQLFVSHGAVAALWSVAFVCLLPASGWVYTFAVCFYTVTSLVFRLKSEELQEDAVNVPTAVGISVVSLFILHSQGFQAWDDLYPAALIAVLAMRFLIVYLERYLHFLEVNENSTGHLPEKEIFFSGIRMVVLFVLFSVLVLFLVLASDFGWLKSILDGLRYALIYLLRKLFSGSEHSEPEFAAPDAAGQPGNDFMGLPDAGEPFFLWDILEVAAKAAVLIGAVWLFVKFLRWLPAFIRERMGRGRTVESGTKAAVWDVREKCGVERPKHAKERGYPFAFLSIDERIRKLYKKRILSAAKIRETDRESEINPALLTAGEWGRRLHSQEMAACYEKARYSDESCTADELRRMRLACRQSAKTDRT